MRFCTLAVATVLLVESAAAQEGAWRAEVLLESEHGMGGAAIGDLDPGSPGNEVAVVNAAGEAWMARREADAWQPVRIHQGAGELIMCTIGDVDPRHAGNEFVGVGMVRGEESLTGPGQVLMVHREHGKWVSKQVFEDSHMIHGVAVGDVSSRAAGNEIIACGFNHRVTLLSFVEGKWCPEVIYVANDRMKIAAVGDVLPDRDGLEVVVSGSDGNVVVLWEDRLGWKHEVIYADAAGQSRVACGEFGVLIGGDGGKVTLARRQGGRWTTECLARHSGKIRGVAIADVDKRIAGPELYACGYSRNVTQHVQDADGFWHTRVIHTAERPLHHLVADELNRAKAGVELLTCGHAGKLIVLIPDRQ
jgi:hypothetical protein